MEREGEVWRGKGAYGEGRGDVEREGGIWRIEFEFDTLLKYSTTLTLHISNT